MKFSRAIVLVSLALISSIFIAAPAFAGDNDWKPITPAELELKTPIVEKDADAEALFWEVRVDDGQPDELSLKNYIRVKIFNERGRESQSKVDLPFYGNTRIKDIAARVIKADGSIVELKKEDVFERTIVKLSGVKLKAKSFALSGVEPGSIIEYRWREVYPGGSANRLKLDFQQEIPVQTVTYYLRPYMGMKYLPFHMGEAKFVKDKDGFSKLTMTNVPAFHEEPRMPPEKEVRSWVFLYYNEEDKTDADKYWKETGKRIFDGFKDSMKANDDVKAAVAGIIGNATTPEEKLQRLYDFCRTKIRNTSDDASGLTDEERAKLKENKSPADTLKRSSGTGQDIDLLFGALAKAAGFDARLALSGNRDDMFFNKNFANTYFLGAAFIAVRVGEEWKFFSPSEMYTPFGMLGWPEEGQVALLTDSKEPSWVMTPMTGPEKSRVKHTAKLKLSDDGTLEGDVRVEYTGHLAYEKKEWNDDDSPTEREKTLRDEVKGRMSTAELSEIKIENVTDPEKPFVYVYHVRVPGYAQRTGKRLFLQPAFFQHGAGPLFPTSNRAHPVYFHFPWSEEDEVAIELPAGFTLDSPDAPAPFGADKLSKYEVQILTTKDQRTLVYKRSFFFGGGATGIERLYYDASSYGQLKSYFEALHKQDNHTITLKQAAATASAEK